jgi:hypothetical protein
LPRDVLLSGANAAQSWDDFDPRAYVEDNYVGMRDDDRRILQHVRDHFISVLDPERPVGRGIDVGSGANLYPTLSMLPFCKRVILWEWGLSNAAWLQSEVKWFSPIWEEYWGLLTKREYYDRYEKAPREELRDRATVLRRNLFQLSARYWDMGTMFFVAESMSNQEREFRLAVTRFIGALRPGAPFAAAFMKNSTGYTVGSLRFPAVAVNEVDIDHCLAPLVDDLKIISVRSEKPLRDGYEGMILALGRAGRAKG